MCEPSVAVLDLLTDTDLNAGMVDHYATEEVVRAIFTLPGALVGSTDLQRSSASPLYGTAAGC